MSAPIVWIILPGAVAVLLFFLRRRERLVVTVGLVLALILAVLAWLDPIGKAIIIGPLSLKLADSLSVLGREFIIHSSDTSILILIYLGVGFWFCGGIVAETGRLFVPGGLLIAGLMTAALAVEPFLFAALLIEMAALVSVPMFSPPGKRVDPGSLRFLILQTLSMPFILFTGWLLAGAEASPGDSSLVIHATILMAIGFALLLAIIPFHTWMPMVAEVSNVYVVAFVFYMLPLIILLFGLGFFEGAGALMVVMGGFWTATQRNLGRMMAFGMMVEIGLSLLAIGAAGNQSANFSLLEVFFTSFLPRGVELGVWALSIVILARTLVPRGGVDRGLNFNRFSGVAQRAPVAAGALILAQFSMAGFPLLAGFPVHLALWEGIGQQSIILTFVALIGSVGLIIGSLRTLTVFVSGTAELRWQSTEKWAERIFLVLGVIFLFLIGIFPQLFLPIMANMTHIFTNLSH
jgi:NADH-quinone oxidoreductase subunit N